MNRPRTQLTIVFSFLALVMLAFQNCDGGSGITVGNPLNSDNPNGLIGELEKVEVKISSYYPEKDGKTLSFFDLCISDVNLGQITNDLQDNSPRLISDEAPSRQVDARPGGSSIGEFDVIFQVYNKAEVTLSDDCGLGYSIQITNDQGTFSSTDRLVVTWPVFMTGYDGDERDVVYNIDVQESVDQLIDVAQADEISGALNTRP